MRAMGMEKVKEKLYFWRRSLPKRATGQADTMKKLWVKKKLSLSSAGNGFCLEEFCRLAINSHSGDHGLNVVT